jgi:gliding motility-associated-like protein
MQIRIFISFISFLLVMPGFVLGQLVAVVADKADTNYAVTVSQDPVFCFSEGAPMQVKYDEDQDKSALTWFQHNPVNNSWDNILASGVKEIIASQPGGYMLEIDEGNGNISQERFWVYNAQALTNVDAEIVYDDCFGVELSALADSVPLIFYDPANGRPGGVQYQLNYEWITEPATNEQHGGKSVKYDAPYEDLSYVVTVTDRFGNEAEGTTDYTAIAVKADYEVDMLKDTVRHERHNETSGSAPIEIQFTDTSPGYVTAREWTFGDAGKSLGAEPVFVFSQEGEYVVSLQVRNGDSGCVDSTSTNGMDELVVNVWGSEIEVPNVFTPNGDGVNDEFRVAYKSLKKFEMVVFNRWGKKVYESNDPVRGWDGKVGGKTGAPGVYFYYIKGEGYNKNEVHKRKGAVHLIRGR